MLFVMKERTKIHIILVCKLYIYGAMDLQLGKIVYLMTQYGHTKFQMSTSLHCENGLVETGSFMKKKQTKKYIILVCKILIDGAMDL